MILAVLQCIRQYLTVYTECLANNDYYANQIWLPNSRSVSLTNSALSNFKYRRDGSAVRYPNINGMVCAKIVSRNLKNKIIIRIVNLESGISRKKQLYAASNHL